MKKKLLFFALITGLTLLSSCTFEIPQNNSTNTSSQTSSQTTSTPEVSSEDIPDGTKIVVNESNPVAYQTTIRNIIEMDGATSNNSILYGISGTVQAINDNGYGNFDITDNTSSIYVYGCSKYKTSIVYGNGKYTYSNNYSFASIGIKPGDYVYIEGIHIFYSYGDGGGVHEFQGYVTSYISTDAYSVVGQNYEEVEPTYTGSYYDSLSTSSTGATFATELHNLMDTTHNYYPSYSSLYNYYQESDPGTNAKYKCFYSGQSTSSVNREHVWAVSLSNNLFPRNNLTYAGSDLHHVRPAIAQYNTIRSNAVFGQVYGNKSVMDKINYKTGGVSYCTGNTFEPADAIKGDVARILMYVYIHYSTKVGGNNQTYYGALDITKVMGPILEDECFALLRKWNAIDPVSQDEITRNNVASSAQGNRNPFIDHPTYADRIWG